MLNHVPVDEVVLGVREVGANVFVSVAHIGGEGVDVGQQRIAWDVEAHAERLVPESGGPEL